ncbi:Vacuolar protein-sorting-associated protein 36, partial [Rhizoclosmatium hyalinum]
MTGDAYTQELAKELSDFLHRVLPRYSGILPLTDLYCLFNRARGVALISPQDLQKSVGLFESLGLPFRVRKFDSGLTVVHSSAFGDDAIATRVVAIVQEQAGMGGWGGGGITALDVAAREGVSIVLAKELLLITEKTMSGVWDYTAIPGNPFVANGRRETGKPWILPPLQANITLPQGAGPGYGCFSNPTQPVGNPLDITWNNTKAVTIENACGPGMFCPYLNINNPATWPVVCQPDYYCFGVRAYGRNCMYPQGVFEPMICPPGFY